MVVLLDLNQGESKERHKTQQWGDHRDFSSVLDCGEVSDRSGDVSRERAA